MRLPLYLNVLTRNPVTGQYGSESSDGQTLILIFRSLHITPSFPFHPSLFAPPSPIIQSNTWYFINREFDGSSCVPLLFLLLCPHLSSLEPAIFPKAQVSKIPRRPPPPPPRTCIDRCTFTKGEPSRVPVPRG